MGYFPVRYDSRVVIYERKMFIRLATGTFGVNTLRVQHFWAQILFGTNTTNFARFNDFETNTYSLGSKQFGY